MIVFDPHPEIAKHKRYFDPDKHKTWYRNDYEEVFRDIANKKIDERGAIRHLVLTDLFFIVYFVMKIESANHPFWVRRCRDVQSGPKTDTLDIWARFHGKSSIITIAETLQKRLKDPERCSAIFAYNRPAAKKHLIAIKRLCEGSDLLKGCFPDVLYGKPETEAPKWNEDDGIVFRRKSTARKESTIEAWGLTEGMPTGSHFEDCVFDDLETEDIRESPEMLAKVFERFQMALINLGTGSRKDTTRIIGTYYSHFGPNIRIGDMKNSDGTPMFKLRIIPGSEDGTRDGKPILMDIEAWNKAKMTRFFNSQQLCNPTPGEEVRLRKELLKPIDRRDLPDDILKFMVIDQAGGDASDKLSNDMWSFTVLGIQPEVDDIGQSNVYLLDGMAEKMTHSEGIESVVRMYLKAGIVQQLGVEKVSLSTTEIHIAAALYNGYGRTVSVDRGNLFLLKPGNRSKEKRVENALHWPLTNGKIWYCTDLPREYIDKLKEEMDKFPFFHVDILDGLAYGYDMFKEYSFPTARKRRNDQVERALRIFEREEEKNKGNNLLYRGMKIAV